MTTTARYEPEENRTQILKICAYNKIISYHAELKHDIRARFGHRGLQP